MYDVTRRGGTVGRIAQYVMFLSPRGVAERSKNE